MKFIQPLSFFVLVARRGFESVIPLGWQPNFPNIEG